MQAAIAFLLLICLSLVDAQCSTAGLAGWRTEWNDKPVTIRAPTVISSSVSAASITIETGGKLIFANENINLKVGWIFVKGGGSLYIGDEDCPITKKIVITFTGTRGSDTPMPYGKKGLAMDHGGIVVMRGYYRGPSWTRLSRTASAASKTLTLKTPVFWPEGSRIVITQSAWDFLNENEVRTITDVSADKKTLTLDAPLRYTHLGIWPEECEVGLLSRNIVLQGDDDSAKSLFGGHVLLRRGKSSIQGVELTRMGQQGLIGRYPLHFHMVNLRDGATSPHTFSGLVKSNSMHSNYQRCISIHDTDGTTVEDNVCYDTYGSMYFLEDASEQNNKFVGNLGVFARQVSNKDPNQLLESDSNPAVYWITNPNNLFVRNVAVSAARGFWWAMPEKVIGITAKTYQEFKAPFHRTIQPRSMPMGAFTHNTGHSCGHCFLMADFVNPDGSSTDTLAGGSLFEPRVSPFVDGNGVPIKATTNARLYGRSTIRNSLSWRCAGSGFWGKGSILIQNTYLFDNQIGFFNSGRNMVQNATVICRSPNYNAHPRDSRIGFIVYDAALPTKIEGVDFYGFEKRLPSEKYVSALTFNGAGAWLPEVQAFDFRLLDKSVIHMEDGGGLTRKTLPFLDTDGSATAAKGATWVGTGAMVTGKECRHTPSLKRDGDSYVCPFDSRFHLMVYIVPPPLPSLTDAAHFTNVPTGWRTMQTPVGTAYAAQSVVSESHTYIHFAKSGTSLPIQRLWHFWFNWMAPGDSLLITIPAPRQGLPLKVTGGGNRVSSIAQLRDGPGHYYDEAEEKLYVVVRARQLPSTSEESSLPSPGQEVMHDRYLLREMSNPGLNVEFTGCNSPASPGGYPSCPAPRNVLTLPRHTLDLRGKSLTVPLAPCTPDATVSARGSATFRLTTPTGYARVVVTWPEPTSCSVVTLDSKGGVLRRLSRGTARFRPPHVLNFKPTPEEMAEFNAGRFSVRVECGVSRSWCSAGVSGPSKDSRTTPRPRPSPRPPQVSGPFTLIGCYNDNAVRDLPERKGQTPQTPASCSKLCQGFKFFGVQVGLECWCGNSYGKYGKVEDERCSMPCQAGNSQFPCGGGWVNSIYRQNTPPRAVGEETNSQQNDVSSSPHVNTITITVAVIVSIGFIVVVVAAVALVVKGKKPESV